MCSSLWHETCDIWHMTWVTWHTGGMNIVSKILVPSSYGLGAKVVLKIFLQIITNLMNEWVTQVFVEQTQLHQVCHTKLENLAWSKTVFFQFNFCRKRRFMKPLLLSSVALFIHNTGCLFLTEPPWYNW